MAHWGIAYAAGPNYNRPWQGLDAVELPRILQETHTAAGRAMTLREKASPVECALIEAIVARHPDAMQPADFMSWTNAYADAMRLAYQAHPHDADVCSLFADAVMSRTPWKLWDLRSGEPSPGASTLEAREALEAAIARAEAAGDTPHVGLLHYYIHLMGNVPDTGSGAACR